MESLSYFERVFLYLGIAMFLVLLASLIFFVIKGKELKPLLLFFLLPILMIGYPSIQEIKYNDIWIKLKQSQEALVENPEDSLLREKVATLTDRIQPRTHTEDQYNSISYSKILLEKPQEAQVFASKALEENKDSQTAKNFKIVASVQEALKSTALDTSKAKIKLDSTKIEQLRTVKLPQRYQPIGNYVIQKSTPATTLTKINN